jgi:hypothetical protein
MASWVQDVQAEFKSKRRDLHINKLRPFKKTLVCNALAKKAAKCFLVMSNKPNMKNYKNKNLGEEKVLALLVAYKTAFGTCHGLLRRSNAAQTTGEG